MDSEKGWMPIETTILAVMRRWRPEGAHWTSDLAHGARVTTRQARCALTALERKGAVTRVVTGNPTSWALPAPSEAGDA